MRYAKVILVTSPLLLAGGITALPLLWMLQQSFTSTGQFSLTAYQRLFQSQSAGLWLTNSLFLASAQTLVSLFACSLAGFALARHHFPGRRLLLLAILATLLLPSQVALPTSWQLIHNLHLLDNYLALLLPSAASALGVLLFYQACGQIPGEYLDAARMDGCDEWRTWWQIALPCIQPPLATFTVLSFTANWNAFLWPQIVIQSQDKYTLAMGMANMSTLPQQRDDTPLLLAATAICVIPSFLLFLASRQSLQQSVNEGVLRG